MFVRSVFSVAVLLAAPFFIISGRAATSSLGPATRLAGEQKQWHRVTLTFVGPQASETGTPNPFRDYRLDVTFTHVASGRVLVVPGYFAADGNAADTSAASGNRWRAELAPDATGLWTYRVSFRAGTDVAVSASRTAGAPVACDGETGSFTIDPTDKSGADFRGKGRLQEVGQPYLQHLGSREYFIKTGAGSPENLLAFADFDNTAKGKNILHTYAPHVKDFRTGDPTWKSGRGKGLIGGLNYLASKGVNSLYFLTMNLGGDGDDVFPYANRTDKTRFDVSKLAQWEIVFAHMDRLGIMLHIITQERENDRLLDGGDVGLTRRLYYRELVARFAHHLGLTWNLGEESTNTTAQRLAQADCLNALDPYLHLIAVHTYPSERSAIYTPLLGNPVIHGASLQIESPSLVHAETLKWATKSAAAGDRWLVALDEIGPADVGALPDANEPGHGSILGKVLWGNLMAGGDGVEWYFGYKYANNDLTCEDWRSRDRLWTLTRYAAEFFRQYLPLPLVVNCDSLTSSTADYCIGKPGAVYAIYLPAGASTSVNLPAGETYSVAWFNSRTGGGLCSGTVGQVSGSACSIGRPSTGATGDWVALLRRVSAGGGSVVAAPPPVSAPTSPASGAVTRLMLVNAANDTDLRALVNGDVVRLSADGAALNIRAEVSGAVGSVRFVLDGRALRTENVAPFALAGDNAGDYAAWKPAIGSHVLRAEPYERSNLGGVAGQPLEINFTVGQ